MKSIYLDHASTTYISPEIVDYICELMSTYYGNPSSIHAMGRQSRALIEKARKIIAKILNVSVGEIYFTSSATEANNMILKRSVLDLGVKTIISSPTEHHCVLHSIDKIVKEHDINVRYLDVDTNGDIDLVQLSELIDQNKINGQVLVSLMHGNNEIGNIHPIEQISEICTKGGALFHCDAVQTIGKLHIDLQATKLNFLSATAHKFHGPKGVGFFYMNNDSILSSYIDGGAQERNIRAGTENLYGIASLAMALQNYCTERAARVSHLLEIRNYFEQQITQYFPDIVINSQGAKNRLPHISSISFVGSEKAEMIMFNLDIHNICASSGSACSAGIEEDSHVLTAIKHPKSRKTIRFSFAPTTTKEEIDYAIETLIKIT
jgi:cysteine desulfurase